MSYCSPIVLVFDIHSASSSRSLSSLGLRACSLRHSHSRIPSLGFGFSFLLLSCSVTQFGSGIRISRIPLPHWEEWLRHPRVRKSQRRCTKVKLVGNRFKSIRARGFHQHTNAHPVAPERTMVNFKGVATGSYEQYSRARMTANTRERPKVNFSSHHKDLDLETRDKKTNAS